MRYLVKVEKPSVWGRVKGIFTGRTELYEVPLNDAPYRSTSRKSYASREWYPSSGSADEALLGAMGSLRDRSRDLDRNEGLARGAIENYVTNVVADGLRPQAKLDHELLGISESLARDFERRAEKIFSLHTSEDTVDFHAQANLARIEAQVLRAVLLDGDCLVIRRYKDRAGAILPTTIQVIEGRRIRNPMNSNFKADLREGIEFDRAGVPIAYHVATAGKDRYLGAETVRVQRFDPEGNRLALHIFDQRLPGQSRGEPFLAPVIEKFKQISRYSEAEIGAAVINAFFSMFVTSESPVFGNGGESLLASDEHGKKEPIERQEEKFGPGTILNMLPGEKLNSAAPGRPNSNFDPFVQAVIKQIGIGLGLPYEVLTQHFQSSYSAARGAILEAWKSFKIRRAFLLSELCQPVWEWIISDAIAEGLLEAPGFDDVMKRKLYLCTQWTGTEMESIDPLKEAKSNEIDIETGIKTRRYIVERQGRDFDKHQREYEEESRIFGKENIAAQNTGNF